MAVKHERVSEKGLLCVYPAHLLRLFDYTFWTVMDCISYWRRWLSYWRNWKYQNCVFCWTCSLDDTYNCFWNSRVSFYTHCAFCFICW